MYRKEKRIPTLLALLLLFTGIGAAFYFDGSSPSLTTKAGSALVPADVHLTNISDNSITVSYITESLTTGTVAVAGNGIKTTNTDDRDKTEGIKPRQAHMFTLKGLAPDTSYTITVQSGNSVCNRDRCPEFIQKTGSKIDSIVELPPISGQIVDSQNKPIDGAIVYLLIGRAAPQSSRSDKSGMFVIPLNNLRTQDLLKRPELTDNSPIQITVKTNPKDYASVLADISYIKKNPKLPVITLGKSYNYLKNPGQPQAQKQVLGSKSKLNLSPTPTVVLSKTGIDILFPKYKLDTTIDSNPKLRGVGIPGEKIVVTVKSTPQTQIVTVDSFGVWEFRPKNPLPPGTHTITITGRNKSGKTETITRQFVVLKSGEAVLGDATPSGELTPTIDPSLSPTGTATISATPTLTLTPTPSNTPTPTLTPSPTETPTPVQSEPTTVPPRAGTSDWTKILVGGGVTLLLVGLKFLL